MAPLQFFPKSSLGPHGQPDAHKIIGEGPAAMKLRDEIAGAGRSDKGVLVLGESGTGKELTARGIHANSKRATRPFVACSAAAIPEGLAQVEMFGNTKDFPNAGMEARPGVFGEADGGTLFLDELGEWSIETQAVPLRALDRGGEFRSCQRRALGRRAVRGLRPLEHKRIGESQVRRADVRFIAATNKDPEALRPDLVSRLGIVVTVPPLRERPEDIPLLVRHLLREHAKECTPDQLERLFYENEAGQLEPRTDLRMVEEILGMPLERNVRELRNLLWRAIVASTGKVVSMPPAVAKPEGKKAVEQGREYSAGEVVACLERVGGNKTKAAEELGLKNRWALDRLIARLGIKGEDE